MANGVGIPDTGADSPLVGRPREVALVADLVARTASGTGGALVLEGEAGIGKSALLDQACTDAWARGCVILRGAADELEGGRPFGLLADAVGALGDDARREVLDLAQSAEPSALDVAPPARFRVLDAVIERIERLDVPALLALDDLHWADPATAFALAALGRRSAALGIGVIAAMRPTPRPPELARTIDVLCEAGAEHVSLTALEEHESTALLERLVGVAPGPRLRSLATGAAGNPLLLIELVAAARDEGSLEGGDVTGTGVPASLRTSVSRRVRALGEETASLLRTAAILGQSFSLDELAVVSGRPLRQLVDPLRDAIAAGLLRETPAGLGFRHDLLRTAVADETPATVRVALHREAARVLAESGAPIERVAAHLVRGAAKGDARAVELLQQAAEKAAASAPATALELVDAALGLAGDADPRRTALLVRRSELLVWAGRPAEAAQQAATVIPSLEGDLLTIARSARSQALFMLGRPSQAIDSWRSTGPVVGDDDALGHGAAALATLFSSDVPGALEAVERAMAMAAGRSDELSRAGMCLALATRSWCRTIAGRFAEALDDSAAAVRLADADPSKVAHRYHPNVMRAMVLVSNGEHDEAIAAVHRGMDVGREIGTVWDRSVYHWILATVHFRTGAWDAAMDDVTAGLALAEESGVRIGIGWPYGAAAMIALHRGEPDVAADWLEAGERSMAEHRQQLGGDWLVWARALTAEAAGDHEGAHALLAIVADLAAQLDAPAMASVVAPELVRLSVAVGDEERARRTVALVDGLAAQAASPVVDAVALRCRGLAAGDPAPLVAAADLLRAVGRVPELAVTLAEAAVAAGRRGDLAAARDLGREAIERYQSIGAVACVARTRGALRSLGVRIRIVEATRPAFGWESLTATESEIVAHVGRGLSNGEIAARLHISRRTVESHLAHVYAKVGVSSRSALAATAATRAP